jgi:L-glyceraldehyde 3-phosphate reductase
MNYRLCGNSGLKLPAISLGLWHNFGGVDDFENARQMCRTAFDLGITHFDLANNYGPPAGSAEENFATILKQDFSKNLRDELVISTKAGYYMWPGPYGELGSRKYLLSSLDQSLKRMGIDRVDIFYSHRFDPNTPLEETIGALKSAVDSGKALYAGISSYTAYQTQRAYDVAEKIGLKILIHQPNYSLFDRWIEKYGLLERLSELGIGSIVFAPLQQGMLSKKYVNGIPSDSRAARDFALRKNAITKEKIEQVIQLDAIAKDRGQTLPQMALAWVLRDQNEVSPVTSALIGASKPSHIVENVKALDNLKFDDEELQKIDSVLNKDLPIKSSLWHKFRIKES